MLLETNTVDLKIFKPEHDPTPRRSRRAFISSTTGVAGLGLGALAALYLGGDSVNPPTDKTPTAIVTQVQKLHKAEPTLPDFETTKELTISYANFLNQLAASNLLKEVPYYERKSTSETLSTIRENANKAAYLFTLDEKYLSIGHKIDIHQQALTDKNYQIQTVKDLLASEQDIFNLMDRLGDQIKAKTGEVSIKAVQSYAELMKIILTYDSSNKKEEQEALQEVFSLISKYLEKHGENTSKDDLLYFQKILSLQELLGNYGDDFSSVKIQKHLTQLTQMVNATSIQRIASEEEPSIRM